VGFADLHKRTGSRWRQLACGAVLAHRRSGSGPPLLLLHGIGLWSGCWEPVRGILERSRDVIAVDLPGFGDSAMLPGTPSVEALADAVEAFATDLGLERWAVAGNSLGGGISLELAARGRVSSACALSPIGFAAGREDAYSRATLRAVHAMTRAVDPFAEVAYGGPVRRTALASLIFARPWRIPAHELAETSRATAHGPGFLPTLPEISRWRPRETACPTIVAWGSRDRLLIFSRQAPRAARVLPGARHVTLQGCGHVPMWDDPEQVAPVILDA
jgi:pimeloyl-ACP methyl ester carboxylesterase